MALFNITGPVTFTGSNTFPGNNTFNFPVPAEFLERLSALETQVSTQQERLNKMDQAIAKVISDFDEATNEIEKDLTDLRDKISRGLSETDKAEAIAMLTQRADRLKALGADPANPVPDQPPV